MRWWEKFGGLLVMEAVGDREVGGVWCSLCSWCWGWRWR